MKASNLLAMIILATIVPLSVSAQTSDAPAAAIVGEAALTAGVVRKLDDDQKKITLKHEALENLGMPPMTMVFRIEKMSLVEKVKVGDRVLFRAERIDGAFVVTKLTRLDAGL